MPPTQAQLDYIATAIGPVTVNGLFAAMQAVDLSSAKDALVNFGAVPLLGGDTTAIIAPGAGGKVRRRIIFSLTPEWNAYFPDAGPELFVNYFTQMLSAALKTVLVVVPPLLS